MRVLADVVASISFLQTAAGGRMHPATGPYLMSLVEFGGEYFGCRLDLTDLAPVAPGDTVIVPIKFLRPDLIKPRLSVGDEFRLQEGLQVIAHCTVQTINAES